MRRDDDQPCGVAGCERRAMETCPAGRGVQSAGGFGVHTSGCGRDAQSSCAGRGGAVRLVGRGGVLMPSEPRRHTSKRSPPTLRRTAHFETDVVGSCARQLIHAHGRFWSSSRGVHKLHVMCPDTPHLVPPAR
eukprot:6573829-Prymnesium_polylepis.1